MKLQSVIGQLDARGAGKPRVMMGPLGAPAGKVNRPTHPPEVSPLGLA